MRNLVDIVIPISSSDEANNLVLDSLISQSKYISTVYRIVSSCGPLLPPTVSFTYDSLSPYYIKTQEEYCGLSLVTYHFSCRLYPGAARNVGLLFSKALYIGFLDVNTKPACDWLASFERQLSTRSRNFSMIGSTRYLSANYVQKIIIAASYGFNPLTTLPGSIVSRQALDLVGFFAPNWRAGEDVDFLTRLNSLFPDNFKSHVPNTYLMRSSNLSYYFLKWIRNYSDSVPCQKLAAQSHVLTLLFALFVLMLAFSWNWIVAGWNESAPAYFANITKYIACILALIYAFLRGVYLPIKKGSLLRGQCNIFDLLAILLVSIWLDVAKTLAFFFHYFIGSRFTQKILIICRELIT